MIYAIYQFIGEAMDKWLIAGGPPWLVHVVCQITLAVYIGIYTHKEESVSLRIFMGVVHLFANQTLAANLLAILAAWLAISGRVKWYTWHRKTFSFFLNKMIDWISMLFVEILFRIQPITFHSISLF